MRQFIMLLATSFITMSIGCQPNKSNNTESNNNILDTPITKPVENITATKDQIERRARSEEFCKSKNIPIYKNQNSLFTETDDKVILRTKDEVVDRALALFYIGLKSEGLEQVNLDKVAKDYYIFEKLTLSEQAYSNAKAPTEQQTIDANWRYEGLHVLLWALGYIDDLGYPDKMCNVSEDVKVIYQLQEQGFRKNAKLRSKKEILDKADLTLRLDWAVTDARMKNAPTPGGLDKGVVFERHYALNWLIKYLNQHWDNITTDT